MFIREHACTAYVCEFVYLYVRMYVCMYVCMYGFRSSYNPMCTSNILTDEKAEDGYVLPPARGGVRSHGLAASAGADRRGGNQEQADATAEITSQTPTHYIHSYIRTYIQYFPYTDIHTLI